MPTDAGVDDVGPGGLDDLRLLHHLAPAVALLHEVEHAQAVHDGKVRTAGLADARDDLLGKANPVLEGPAPFIGTVVGPTHQELVDQVALRAHDLHPIIAGLAGEQGAADIGPDRALDAAAAEDPGAELADGRLALGRGHAERMVAVASAVQDLQGNAAARGVHGLGDLTVLGRLGGAHQSRPMGRQLARPIGRDAAGHDQARPTFGTLGIEAGELGEAALLLLEPHVHRSHDGPVGHGHPRNRQRLQQMGILGMSGGSAGHAPKFGQCGHVRRTGMEFLNRRGDTAPKNRNDGDSNSCSRLH